MNPQAEQLMTAMRHIHKGAHIYRKTCEALPEHILKQFDPKDTVFNLNAEAGLISDIVIELLR